MRIVPRLVLLLAAAPVASPALAAGAPPSQRFAEMRAILDHRGVVAAFAGAPLDRIQYVRQGRYRLSAGSCGLDVAIVHVPVPPGGAGAPRFEVRPAARMCSR